jgi:hypothetical protein
MSLYTSTPLDAPHKKPSVVPIGFQLVLVGVAWAGPSLRVGAKGVP